MLLNICFDWVISDFRENFYGWFLDVHRYGYFMICESDDFVNVNFVLQIVYLREILVIIVTREDFLLCRYKCLYMFIFLRNYDSYALSLSLHGLILT